MSEWKNHSTPGCPVNNEVLVDVLYIASDVPLRGYAGAVSWPRVVYYREVLGDTKRPSLPTELCPGCGVMMAGHDTTHTEGCPALDKLRDADTPAPDALHRQEGGSHYKDMPIQPVEFIHANALGYFEGNVIKYVSRWRKKNGMADLQKARHYIDLLIELESKKQ